MPRGIKCRFCISLVTQITDIIRNECCRFTNYRRVNTGLRVTGKILKWIREMDRKIKFSLNCAFPSNISSQQKVNAYIKKCKVALYPFFYEQTLMNVFDGVLEVY